MAAEYQHELWPDTCAAVDVFMQLGTQWRFSAQGACGLDYGVIPFVLRTAGVPRPDWPDTFEALRIMERAALAEIHER